MSFCLSCARLNICRGAFRSLPGTDLNPRLEAPVYRLGTLRQIAKNTACPLCCLIHGAIHSGPLGHVEVDEIRGIQIHGTWINAQGPKKEQRLRCPTLCLLLWPDPPHILSQTFKIVVRALSAAQYSQPHFARLLPSCLNIPLIKRWIKRCETEHSACIETPRTKKPTPHFLVIDVSLRCIVAAPDHCRYLTLSYVWGSSNQLQLSVDNLPALSQRSGLPFDSLKKTIQDAILLTERLGERYLWVDALCIVQDSIPVRRQAIEDMGQIYADSLLTLVAGACGNAGEGLPGVRSARPFNQNLQAVAPNFTLTAHLDVSSHLEHSTYNERAWTFQEFQLASRVLIFAPNNQVYFSCSEVVYSEDVVEANDGSADAPMLADLESMKLRLDSNSPWSTYQQAVTSYSTRKMTKVGDVLNAFSGVLRKITAEHSIEGLPIDLFDMSLLWQPTSPSQRRIGFASWSWAGWMGSVKWLTNPYSTSNHDTRSTENELIEKWVASRTWISFYTSWGTDPLSLAYRLDGPRWIKGRALTAAAQEDRFPGLQHDSLPQMSLLTQRVASLGYDRRCMRYLQFWTASVYFWISPDSYTSVSGPQWVPLYDNEAQGCGSVLLQDSQIISSARKAKGTHEFIVLSEKLLHHQSDSVSVHEPIFEFNVMMLTWKNGIAERVGLGRVSKYAIWNSCRRPLKWKEIILG